MARNEYEREIDTLEGKVRELRAQGHTDETVEEYLEQIQNLRALLKAADRLFDLGVRNAELAEKLKSKGFGSWDFDNVYSFVYERTLDAEWDGTPIADLAKSTDYGELLQQDG